LGAASWALRNDALATPTARVATTVVASIAEEISGAMFVSLFLNLCRDNPKQSEWFRMLSFIWRSSAGSRRFRAI
jgi:hypothetical protein